MMRHEACHAWEDLLALRLEDLSAVDRASLEAHLTVCPACTAINGHYRQIQASLATFPTPAMEPIPYEWKQENEGREESRQQGEREKKPREPPRAAVNRHRRHRRR